MVERGSGKIVFVASLLSFQGGVTVPGYAASKGGDRAADEGARQRMGGAGVNVNAIAPGYIATDNTQALRDDRVAPRQILDRIPAGRWADARRPRRRLRVPRSRRVRLRARGRASRRRRMARPMSGSRMRSAGAHAPWPPSMTLRSSATCAALLAGGINCSRDHVPHRGCGGRDRRAARDRRACSSAPERC